MTTILTNAIVQASLAEAIATIVVPNDEVLAKKAEFVKTSLELIALYSSSGNDNPGLRGLGLEEALSTAESILAVGGDISRVHMNFKAMGSVLFF